MPGFAPCATTAVGPVAADPAHFLAQRVVGALGQRYARVDIATGPGLDAGVDVERVEFPAQADQRHRGHVDRKVDDEPARDHRRQHLAVVVRT